MSDELRDNLRDIYDAAEAEADQWTVDPVDVGILAVYTAAKAEALEEAQAKVREVPYLVGLESDGDFTAITWSQRSLILFAIRAAGTETGGV